MIGGGARLGGFSRQVLLALARPLVFCCDESEKIVRMFLYFRNGSMLLVLRASQHLCKSRLKLSLPYRQLTTTQHFPPQREHTMSFSSAAASDVAVNLPSRTESDSMGELHVPVGTLWGAQTQRSLENFPIGGPESKMPLPVVKAMATVKKCCALYNVEQGMLDESVGNAIAQAADEVVAGP